jgi:hypothetical protein
LPRASLAALAFIILLELIVIAPHAEVIALAASAAWMALPGVPFVWRALGSTPVALSSAWLIGPALGFGFSVFGLLLWWAAGVQNWLAVVLAPLFTWVMAVAAHRFGGATLRLPAIDARDGAAVGLALLVVPLITLRPYDRVRETTPEGEAYRAYFTADFVWAMTVTAELAKGDVPPANPFLSSQPMRYYWMSHLLSGAVYRNARPYGVAAEQVVLVNGVAFSLAFVAFFYWIARAAGAGPWASSAMLAIGFLANSYEGADMLRAIYARGDPLEIVRSINIDAVTRWFYQGMPVDGLQRLFLYQPHHLTGYVLSLAALWLIALAEDVTDISIALWAGILLGLGFLFSTFTAIIVGVAVGALYALRLAQQRKVKALLQCAILGAAPVAVGIGVSSALGYTDPGEGLLIQFGLNPVATRRWPLMLLLSFGPLLFAGIAGLARWRWALTDGAAAGSLVLSALVFYFIADVPDMGGVWVGWRSGHLLLIAFAIIGAAAITAAWPRRALRPVMLLAAVILVPPAVPTVAFDVFNAQDVENREAGPAFPWTLVVTPEERAALDWIKVNTPPDALVQVEPRVRDAGTWAYIPAFAERRMAAGLPISMIPLRPYQQVTDQIRDGIFRAGHAADAHATARLLQVQYVVVGEVERAAYPAGVARLAEAPALFEEVFRNERVTIYRVASD